MMLKRFSMPLSEYVDKLAGKENEELSMKLILSPFGVCYGDSSGDGDFLMGHFVDDLRSEFPAEKNIDLYDIASSAWDLGFEPAGAFLDHGHKLLQGLMHNPGEVKGF